MNRIERERIGALPKPPKRKRIKICAGQKWRWCRYREDTIVIIPEDWRKFIRRDFYNNAPRALRIVQGIGIWVFALTEQDYIDYSSEEYDKYWELVEDA